MPPTKALEGGCKSGILLFIPQFYAKKMSNFLMLGILDIILFWEPRGDG